MFGSDVNTVPDNVNMNATPIGWCGLHPFITGGVIGALAGGVGCLAGCMLRDKRNQATWKVLGNDIWKKYTVKRTDGKEITVQEIRKFYANPDIYGGWWNYLRDIPIYQVEERDKDNNNNDNSIEKNINIKDYVSNNDYKNNNDDNIKNNKIVFTIQKRDNMFIKGKEGQELIKRFLKEIPEGGIKIGDEIDLKKIYNMIISNQGRLKEFLDFLISHYEVNKDADILSFITSVLISLGDDELIKFLMGDENLKKVVLKIMDESEDEGVVALRETLREEAIKIVSVKEFFKDNDLGKQIQALSFLLTVPGLMDAANTNGELNDWFISLLKYYQNKPIPKDSIPLIIGLLSKMDINDILKTKELKAFFNKIVAVYDNLENDGKKEIVSFAISILDKISKPIEQDNDGTYDWLLKFIINKLMTDGGLSNDVLNDDRVIDLVLKNNDICFKILPLIMRQYKPADIIPYLIPNPQEEGQQNEEINKDKGKQFLIAFLKQFGTDIGVDEWKDIFAAYEDINVFLTKLLKASIESNKIPTKELWRIICQIADEERNNKNDPNKPKEKQIPNDIIQIVANHINKMNNEELNVLVNEVDAGQLMKLLLAILDDIDKDKGRGEKKKYNKDDYKKIFEKIVNEKNIEAFIKIILNNENLKTKILNDDNLKKLFLLQIIKQPNVTIQHFFDVDDNEGEIKDDDNNENLKNKKPTVQEFLNFFLLLWEDGIKKQVLKKEDIENFLKKILTHVKNNTQGQAKLDILWTVVDKILIAEDMKNMPESCLKLLYGILSQMDGEHLINFLMNNEKIKKVILEIMDTGKDGDVVNLRETLREEAIKIVSVKEFFKDNDLGKQIQALSFLLTVPGLMDAANTNGELNDWFIKLLNYYQNKEVPGLMDAANTNGELNDWFIKLLNYYQNKDLPQDSIPLIIGLFSNMKAEDIAENIDKLKAFFNKILTVYDNLENDGKTEIVTFAIDILNKISKPIKQDNDGTYDWLLKFIINKLMTDGGLSNDVLNDDRVIDLVLKNNDICFKILPLIMRQYKPADIIPYLIPNPQEEGQQNEEINKDKGKQFLIAFLKKFGTDISVKDWEDIFSTYKDINDFLTKLLKASIKNNKILTKELWRIICQIATEEELNNENDPNKPKEKQIPNDIIQIVANHINKMNNEELNVLVNEVDAGQLMKLLLAILDDIDKDKNKNKNKKKKYDEDVYEQIFTKIVNEKTIEAFIKIILNNENLKTKILNDDNLKKLFLQYFIKQQPDVIIQHLLDVDEYEEEINEDQKDNVNDKKNIKNKKRKGQAFSNFFLRLLNDGIEKQVLKKEDIENFLKKILKYVKTIDGQRQLDILWTVVDTMLSAEDMQNMPDSFWKLVSNVIVQVHVGGKTIPGDLLTKINDCTKNYRIKYPEKSVNNNKKNKKNDSSSGKDKTNPYHIQTFIVDQTSKNNGNTRYVKDDNMVINKLNSKTIKISSNCAVPITTKTGKTEYCEEISERGLWNMQHHMYGGKAEEYSVTNNISNKNNMLSSTIEKVKLKPHIDRRKENIITNIEQNINNKNNITVNKSKINRQNTIRNNNIINNDNNNVVQPFTYERKVKEMDDYREKCYYWSKEDYDKNRKKAHGSGNIFG